MDIVHRGTVVVGLVTLRDRQVVVLRHRRTEHSLLPVHQRQAAISRHGPARVDDRRRARTAMGYDDLLQVRVTHLRTTHSISLRILVVVGIHAPLDPVSGRHDRHVSLRCRHREVGRGHHRRLAVVGTLLARHDDDAVGTTRTIDGTRRGILQHLDGLNVLRVQLLQVEVLVHGHPVHHIQRIGIAVLVDARRTAYLDLYRRARCTTGRLYVDTRQLALQRRGNVRNRAFSQLVTLHLGHGIRHVTLLHRAIADDHQFLQLVGIRAHVHVRTAVLHRRLLRTVSDVRHLYLAHLAVDRQHVVTVHVRHRAARLSDSLHRSTNHGLTHLVNHMTLDGHRLGLRHYSRQQQHDDCPYLLAFLHSLLLLNG